MQKMNTRGSKKEYPLVINRFFYFAKSLIVTLKYTALIFFLKRSYGTNSIRNSISEIRCYFFTSYEIYRSSCSIIID